MNELHELTERIERYTRWVYRLTIAAIIILAGINLDYLLERI